MNPRIKVKLARVAKNLTQAELADKVGVTRQTIGLIENGKYNPTLYLCLDMAKVLDKTLNDLFWEESGQAG
jgi:putative transcriptional regulator